MITKSPADIAADLLGNPSLPTDGSNAPAPIAPSQVRQMLIQAVTTDREQQKPDFGRIADTLLAQYPADMAWTENTVRVLVMTALAFAQAQGSRFGQKD